ncbi:MAG: PUA domain-containing protein [Candidatus Bathyarchaeia archaeon]
MSQRKALRARLAKDLLQEVSSLYGLPPNYFGKPSVEAMEIGGRQVLLLDGEPALVKVGNSYYPILSFEPLASRLPRVIVDMGAVPHICNGAHVMVPGIRGIEGDFGEGAPVAIIDEKHGKRLAVGRALMDSSSIPRAGKGRAIENVHYVGDRIWRTLMAGKGSRS